MDLKELFWVLILGAAPIFELRGAIPLALFQFGWTPLMAFGVAVLGNIMPVLIVPFFLEWAVDFLGKHLLFFKKILNWLFERTRRQHSLKFERFKEAALVGIVAIPLPFTGAWTGILAAYVFGVPKSRAVPLIILGVLIAGLLVTGIAFLPQKVLGQAETRQVVINEIAWMGTATGSNDEWIELYYPQDLNGRILDLEGWRLEWDEGQRLVELSGSFEPGSFFVLERTDETTLPDIAADLLYAGALKNSGETLRLFDKSGQLVDELDFSDGWPAGNNSSKETMERINPLAGGVLENWASSKSPGGTPGQPNSVLNQTSQGQQEQEAPDQQSEETPSQTTSTPEIISPGKASSGSGLQPLPEIKIGLVEGEITRPVDQLNLLVGEPIVLGIITQGRFDRLKWNLGNGEVRQGDFSLQEIRLQYFFAGKYIITLEAQFQGQKVQDQAELVVYPDGLIISEFLPNPKGSDEAGEWIEVANFSKTTIDLGGLLLDDKEGGSRPFLIPESTFIMPGGFLVFPRSLTGIALNNDTDQVRLLNETGGVLSAVDYKDSRQGEVGVYTTHGYQWSSKPTPGFSNIVNPRSDFLQKLGSVNLTATKGEPRLKELAQSPKELDRENPLVKIELIKAKIAQVSPRQDILLKAAANSGALTKEDNLKRKVVLGTAIVVSLGLVLLAGMLKRKPF
jgi:uncharacterized membrane protein